MGTETYAKNGQVSKKDHRGKNGGKEVYKENRFEPCEPLAGGPDAFERKYNNKYRKTSLPSQDMDYGTY